MTMKRIEMVELSCDICPEKFLGLATEAAAAEWWELGLESDLRPALGETHPPTFASITVCPDCSRRSYLACGAPPPLEPKDVRKLYVMRRAHFLLGEWINRVPRLPS